MTSRPWRRSPKQEPELGADAEFDADVQEWIDIVGRVGEPELAALRTSVNSLPARSGSRRQGRRLAAAAASIAVLLGLGGLAIGRLPGPTIGAQPPNPAAYAGDPRLAACGDRIGKVARAFEMTHARWFPLYFPGWWKGAQELEVDDPALVALGPEVPRGISAGAPGTSRSDEDRLGYQMCIAVGSPGDARIHEYGWTRFDRIVPVLSANDIARADRLDPDVLADPANWSSPERLAPCGGLTSDVEYVFEATPLRDFGRYFSGVADTPVAAFDRDEPATVVVLRERSTLPIHVVSVFQNDVGGPRRDVCVIFSGPSTLGDAVLVRDVGIAGFRVRLDRMPEPTPTPAPSLTPRPTPEPVPFPIDVRLVLDCEVGVSTVGPTGPMDVGEEAATADAALRAFLRFVTNAFLVFPANGFVDREGTSGARLFVYVVDGRVRAAVAATTSDGGPTGPWTIRSVGSCDPAEWDPATPTGADVTVWNDADGNRVSTAIIFERDDCYGASVLRLNGQLFLRDPNGGVDPAQLETTYEGDVRLPSGAVRQPYSQDGRRLFTRADGKAIYVSTTTGFERWPHVRGNVIQRIDCN